MLWFTLVVVMSCGKNLNILLALVVAGAFAAAPLGGSSRSILTVTDAADIFELQRVLYSLLPSGVPTRDSDSDANGDGEVDILDLQTLVYAALGAEASERPTDEEDSTSYALSPRWFQTGNVKVMLAVRFAGETDRSQHAKRVRVYLPETEGKIPLQPELASYSIAPNAPPIA